MYTGPVDFYNFFHTKYKYFDKLIIINILSFLPLNEINYMPEEFTRYSHHSDVYKVALSKLKFGYEYHLGHQYLSINACSKTEIPNEIYELNDLKILTMRGKNLQYIPCNISNLTNLQWLNIYNTEIEFIDTNDLYNLRKLCFNNNGIYELSFNFMFSGDLTWLDVSHNNISYISDDISWLVNLQHLDISHNKLESLPLEIQHFSNLQHLDLSHNSFYHFPLEIQHESLSYLSLSHNYIEKIPPKISRLDGLCELDMSCNRIEHISNEIFGGTLLSKLNLDKNLICYLPYFSQPIELEELVLSNNYISKINNSFSAKYLIHLDLHNNKLDKIPKAFENLTTLKTLDLRGNDISHIPDNLKHLPIKHLS